jgi:AraC-like DNA-binding protein
MLDLAGIGTAMTQREALRERIKQHVAEHLGDARLSVDSVAWALNCSRRHLYNAFSEEPDGVAGYILLRRLEACCQCFGDRAHSHRSITEIALGFGLLPAWPTSAASSASTSASRRATIGAPPAASRPRVC